MPANRSFAPIIEYYVILSHTAKAVVDLPLQNPGRFIRDPKLISCLGWPSMRSIGCHGHCRESTVTKLRGGEVARVRNGNNPEPVSGHDCPARCGRKGPAPAVCLRPSPCCAMTASSARDVLQACITRRDACDQPTAVGDVNSAT